MESPCVPCKENLLLSTSEGICSFLFLFAEFRIYLTVLCWIGVVYLISVFFKSSQLGQVVTEMV
ncbi:hypothetical protein DJ69_14050 [Halorubrum persicum]|uniref:Uncharacterized protein n=1 Tax=Halorubrum persicum TaxID=1383844 RepID=A0A2G1WG87_9EURY|nr:hypothetical protein DJ69_14050 [Halorubrum persicum]